jgi:DNA repair exonuclease SbcCD ATPase subunit
MNEQDFYIEQYREEGLNHIKPKKLFGMYRARDIDKNLEEMSRAYAGMQDTYQERFEEQRLSLLSLSRERDELLREKNALEANAQDNTDLKRRVEELTAENSKLQIMAADYEQQTQEAQVLRTQNTELNEQLILAQDEYRHATARSEDEIIKLRSELTQSYEKISQLEAELIDEQDDKNLQIKKRNEQIRLMSERYQVVMKDHAQALTAMAEAYSGHASSIAELDKSAIERLK